MGTADSTGTDFCASISSLLFSAPCCLIDPGLWLRWLHGVHLSQLGRLANDFVSVHFRSAFASAKTYLLALLAKAARLIL